MQTYEWNEEMYHLHYTIGRVELIESILGTSVTSIVLDAGQKQKFPQVRQALTLFAYGLMNENGVYMPAKAAMAFAEEQMQKDSFVGLASEALGQLLEDCGFLFQGGSSSSNT